MIADMRTCTRCVRSSASSPIAATSTSGSVRRRSRASALIAARCDSHVQRRSPVRPGGTVFGSRDARGTVTSMSCSHRSAPTWHRECDATARLARRKVDTVHADRYVCASDGVAAARTGAYLETGWAWRSFPLLRLAVPSRARRLRRFSHMALERIFDDAGLETITCGYDCARADHDIRGKLPGNADAVRVDDLGGFRENWGVDTPADRPRRLRASAAAFRRRASAEAGPQRRRDDVARHAHDVRRFEPAAERRPLGHRAARGRGHRRHEVADRRALQREERDAVDLLRPARPGRGTRGRS